MNQKHSMNPFQVWKLAKPNNILFKATKYYVKV